MQNVNINYFRSGLTAALCQANTLPAPELVFIFESKGEIQLESVCKSFAHLRKTKQNKKNLFVHYKFTKPHNIWPEQMVLGYEQDK